MKYPAKDKIDIGQVMLDAPHGLDLFGATNSRRISASASSSRFKIAALFTDLQGVALNHSISDIARQLLYRPSASSTFSEKTVPPLFSRLRFMFSG